MLNTDTPNKANNGGLPLTNDELGAIVPGEELTPEDHLRNFQEAAGILLPYNEQTLKMFGEYEVEIDVKAEWVIENDGSATLDKESFEQLAGCNLEDGIDIVEEYFQDCSLLSEVTDLVAPNWDNILQSVEVRVTGTEELTNMVLLNGTKYLLVSTDFIVRMFGEPKLKLAIGT